MYELFFRTLMNDPIERLQAKYMVYYNISTITEFTNTYIILFPEVIPKLRERTIREIKYRPKVPFESDGQTAKNVRQASITPESQLVSSSTHLPLTASTAIHPSSHLKWGFRPLTLGP